MKSELPVAFDKPEELPVAVKIPPAKKKRYRAAMVEAAAFSKFGVHVLKLRSTSLAKLGRAAEDAGIKHIGHGRVIVAADQAENTMMRLDEMVENLAKELKPDYPLILETLRLKKDFNSQLITTAKVHFSMEKQPMKEGLPGVSMPFPAGAPIMIAVGAPPGAPAPEKKTKAREPKELKDV